MMRMFAFVLAIGLASAVSLSVMPASTGTGQALAQNISAQQAMVTSTLETTPGIAPVPASHAATNQGSAEADLIRVSLEELVQSRRTEVSVEPVPPLTDRISQQTTDHAPPARKQPGAPSEMAEDNRVLVKFRRGVGAEHRRQAHQKVGGKVLRVIPGIDVEVVEVGHGQGHEASSRYSKNPQVLYAEPDYLAEAIGSFDDPFAEDGTQWAIAKVQADEAWAVTHGDPLVRVAVLDTGVDQGVSSTHPDLAGKVTASVNFSASSTDHDLQGHGTHVAGTIAAATNNGIGVVGLGFDVTIISGKVLGDNGSGSYSSVADGIVWAADNGASVISMSLGGSAYSLALEDAVNYAWNHGVVVVAAAGNSGDTSPHYPAYYENAIAVVATDANDQVASFSTRGAWTDIGAPGVGILSTLVGSNYGYKSGTSMATPHVAGLAALLKSQNGGLSPDQVKRILTTTAEDLGDAGWDPLYASGRINALRAVQAVAQGNTSFPTAAISSPGNGDIVSGTTVNVSGTAAGTGFSDYRVEYAVSGSNSWNPIAAATAPVVDGLLATWDTRSLRDGEYSLLLTVTDTLNRQIYDAATITVDSYEATISFPTQLFSLGTIDVLGTAATRNGVPFASYNLEWGVGSSPASFLTTGITLVNGGLQPVNDGKLATWDASGLSDGQTYTLRLTVVSGLGGSEQHSVTVRGDADLVPGWPVVLSTTSKKFVVPTVADLDGDGSQEVILAGPHEHIRVLNKDGSDFPGFPVVMNPGDEFRWGVNVADLDGNGTREIIAVVKNASGSPRSSILVQQHDGTPYPGWPVPSLKASQDSWDLTPSVGDLNGDGKSNLITIEVFTWVSHTDVTLHAYKLDGTELPGFPKVLQLPPTGFTSNDIYPSKHGVTSLVDLDGDRSLEVAWSYSNRVYLFDHQGNVLPGWPFIAASYNGKTMLFENASASGDLDGDGQLELFSAARGHDCGFCETQLFAWNRDGSVLSGWPKTDQSDGIRMSNIVTTQNTPALIDIDNDGKDEVVVGFSTLAVFDDIGRVLFSNIPIATNTQPSASDVDGDGHYEFSGNRDNKIGIADDTGQYYWSRNMPSGGTHNTMGVLADLDGNGTVELVVAHADLAPSNALYLWEISNTGPGTASGEWSMFNHDAARTGRQGTGPTSPPQDDVPPPAPALIAPGDGTTTNDATPNFEWTGVTDPSGVSYQLQVDDSVDFSSPELAVSDLLMPTYNPSQGSGDGAYSWRVRAVDGVGNSSNWSTVWGFTIDTNTPPPSGVAAPSHLAATLAGNLATLTWRDNSDDEDEFLIERGRKVKGNVEYLQVASVQQNVTTFSERVSQGATWYRVRALNQSTGAYSSYSNEVSIKVTGRDSGS